MPPKMLNVILCLNPCKNRANGSIHPEKIGDNELPTTFYARQIKVAHGKHIQQNDEEKKEAVTVYALNLNKLFLH
jgi:hypothetical protein